MPRKSFKSRLIDDAVFQALGRMFFAADYDEEGTVFREVMDNLIAILACRYGTNFIHGSVIKSRSWCADILPNMDLDRFRQMVRVSWVQFQIILDKMKDDPIFRPKLQIPVEVQLMVTLYRLGSYGEGASVAKIANLFGLGDGGTVDIVTKRVFEAILRKKKDFLCWPNAEERATIVAATYDELPYCVGYVDGTEIPLAEKPCVNADDYYSRKQRFSIKAQIVVDHNLVVRSVLVGYPGSVHDARIFSLCQLGRRPADFFSGNQWLAGDSAYRLTTTMMTPFKRSSATPLTDEQKAFNKKFCKYRVRVEHCFGAIKERFNSLKELRLRIKDKASVKLCCAWFAVCVVLHNILKLSDVADERFESVESDAMFEEDSADIDTGDVQEDIADAGVLKRNALLSVILNN